MPYLEEETTVVTAVRHAERVSERAVRRNPVLALSAVAALITMVFVPPSPDYIDYFDWHTLTCLTCILVVLAAIESSGLMDYIAHSIAERVSSTRRLVVVLVLVTLVYSMFLSNDMTLVTMLPLALILLKSVHREKAVPLTFTLITLTANLAGMLFPFGNPHNLYLYSIYHVDFGTFVATMAPSLALAMLLVLACCAFIRPEPFRYRKTETLHVSHKRALLYAALFATCILMTLNVIPYLAGALIVVGVMAATDRGVLAKADYALVLTFACIFVFSGNLSHIDAVTQALEKLLDEGAFLATFISSQAISNVPSAILISHFTSDWTGVALGSNIGAMGTPIASLATLIMLRQYRTSGLGGMGRFVGLYELFNLGLLAVMIPFELFVMGIM